MERRFQRRSFAPIKQGDELDVKIEAVGAKGDGIAKVKGFVIFVPGAKEGENVKVRITKVFRKVGFAEIVGEGSSSEQIEETQEESDENSDDLESEESTEEEY
ncbi:TRAM domain-containing protein [Candidatus Woesearchaeota archaeon]|nr:TRAM domain-containing protein [Candidatus Woesearchaeota archaeon]